MSVAFSITAMTGFNCCAEGCSFCLASNGSMRPGWRLIFQMSYYLWYTYLSIRPSVLDRGLKLVSHIH
jgi:hypothetical protein